MKNIIERIRDPRSRPSHVDRHIAMITGESIVPNPDYYHNIKTGEDYHYVAGALGWPYVKPGFGLVVAVVKTEPWFFKVIEEFEHKSVKDILEWALDIREKYGFSRTGLLSYWYGDIERFMSMLANFNNRLTDNRKAGLYVTPPYDFDVMNAFEIYLNRIKSCLSGQKTLYFGEAKALINHIKNLPPEIVKGRIEDYPAVSALGFVIHSLMVSRPWESAINDKDGFLKPTFEDYAVKHERDTIRWLEGNDPYFPDEEIETEDRMIPTIQED